MRRILAVDDNKDILELLQYILEDYGYKVLTLADGHNLFEKINEYRPDLILLDIMLGDMDGRELCKEVKQKTETNNIPVILISASHDAGDLTRHENGKPDGFIPKPFDINTLLNTVQRQIAA
ncbi:response regulator [Mucilaginibacter limnophilus]|uniref:response regulator n=1 Tax=Mucilaginibacter limnophilus TaxID=1932778 RepID=UPI001F0C34A3|nr:response regulator [Mucilaginibacter limnophilus]